MATAIAIVYYNLIKSGKRTIEQVPLKLRGEVEVLLNEDNRDAK